MIKEALFVCAFLVMFLTVRTVCHNNVYDAGIFGETCNTEVQTFDDKKSLAEFLKVNYDPHNSCNGPCIQVYQATPIKYEVQVHTKEMKKEAIEIQETGREVKFENLGAPLLFFKKPIHKKPYIDVYKGYRYTFQDEETKPPPISGGSDEDPLMIRGLKQEQAFFRLFHELAKEGEIMMTVNEMDKPHWERLGGVVYQGKYFHVYIRIIPVIAGGSDEPFPHYYPEDFVPWWIWHTAIAYSLTPLTLNLQMLSRKGSGRFSRVARLYSYMFIDKVQEQANLLRRRRTLPPKQLHQEWEDLRKDLLHWLLSTEKFVIRMSPTIDRLQEKYPEVIERHDYFLQRINAVRWRLNQAA